MYSFSLFHLFSDRRDLPSFPTRRSSDLRKLGDGPLPAVSVSSLDSAVAPTKRSRMQISTEMIVVAHSIQAAVLREGHVRDRKSTRLNSSHANISYAVFCLKNKAPSALLQ